MENESEEYIYKRVLSIHSRIDFFYVHLKHLEKLLDTKMAKP